MDFGNTPKLTPPGTGLVVPRSEVLATAGSVAVELPPEKTVQSVKAGDAVLIDLSDRNRADSRSREETAVSRRQDDVAARQQSATEDAADTIDSRIVIEPRTRSVVMQKRDTDTGETVELVPDEATLKLRIYARQQAERTQAIAEARTFERTA